MIIVRDKRDNQTYKGRAAESIARRVWGAHEHRQVQQQRVRRSHGGEARRERGQGVHRGGAHPGSQ